MNRFLSLKSLLVGLLVALAGLMSMPTPLQAQACEDVQCDSDDRQCLEQKKQCLEAKIAETRRQAATLRGAIEILNGQISLQQLQVNQTLAEIGQLEDEISDLSTRIEGLSISLDRLGAVLIERVRSQYKQSRSSPELRLLGSESFSSLITQMKYMLLAQRQTVDTMERTENQRLEYDEQKRLKEEKQAEVEVKRRQLEGERAALAQKRSEEQHLLTITNNSEQRFQSLLAEANRQLLAFRGFVTSRGGASILSGQTKKIEGWGYYYSQRDSEWGNKGIGNSNSSMAGFGCLVTSMAMIASYYDKSLTPGQIADSSSPFFANTAYMNQGTWTVNGVTMTRTRVGSSTSALDAELSGGPVIVGIGAGPDHFVVIKEKKDGQYIMHDPFEKDGYDKKFTDYYSLSSISAVDRVRVN